MLDYERVRPDQEIDVELRYTAIRLQSFGGTSEAVKGHADAITASLYTRYRAPTGMTALDRPVRYVLEYAFTRYLGDQPSLGFNDLHSVGAGLELDSSAHDIFITRTRLVGRYRFGNNVSGFGDQPRGQLLGPAVRAATRSAARRRSGPSSAGPSRSRARRPASRRGRRARRSEPLASSVTR